MKDYLFLFLIFILSLLQGVLLPLNLVLFLLLFYATFGEIKKTLWFAFMGGFLLDLALSGRLGLSSFYFLVFVAVLILYRRKYDAHHPVFLTTFVFLATSLYGFFTKGIFNLRESEILAIFAFSLSVIVKKFFFASGGGEGKLTV